MAKPIALVVDDEPDIRELLGITLERMDQPGVIYAEGGAKTVWTDFKKQKSVPLPDWMRKLVE